MIKGDAAEPETNVNFTHCLSLWEPGARLQSYRTAYPVLEFKDGNNHKFCITEAIPYLMAVVTVSSNQC